MRGGRRLSGDGSKREQAARGGRRLELAELDGERESTARGSRRLVGEDG